MIGNDADERPKDGQQSRHDNETNEHVKAPVGRVAGPCGHSTVRSLPCIVPGERVWLSSRRTMGVFTQTRSYPRRSSDMPGSCHPQVWSRIVILLMIAVGALAPTNPRDSSGSERSSRTLGCVCVPPLAEMSEDSLSANLHIVHHRVCYLTTIRYYRQRPDRHSSTIGHRE